MNKSDGSVAITRTVTKFKFLNKGLLLKALDNGWVEIERLDGTNYALFCIDPTAKDQKIDLAITELSNHHLLIVFKKPNNIAGCGIWTDQGKCLFIQEDDSPYLTSRRSALPQNSFATSTGENCDIWQWVPETSKEEKADIRHVMEMTGTEAKFDSYDFLALSNAHIAWVGRKQIRIKNDINDQNFSEIKPSLADHHLPKYKSLTNKLFGFFNTNEHKTLNFSENGYIQDTIFIPDKESGFLASIVFYENKKLSIFLYVWDLADKRCINTIDLTHLLLGWRLFKVKEQNQLQLSPTTQGMHLILMAGEQIHLINPFAKSQPFIKKISTTDKLIQTLPDGRIASCNTAGKITLHLSPTVAVNYIVESHIKERIETIHAFFANKDLNSKKETQILPKDVVKLVTDYIISI